MLKIEKGNTIYPFSKGILARSMLPSGLSIETIYEITEEVESFFQSEEKPIPALEIHEEVIRILEKRGLKNEKKRYQVSHDIAQLEKPLVIIIGGAAGVGKSTIAAALRRRLGIERVIGTDEIREIMRYVLPKDLIPALHESSFDAGEVMSGPDIEENVLIGFSRQAKLVNRGVHAYIKRTEKEGLKAIFNGVHLVPGYLNVELESSVLIFHYLLTVEEKERHIERFHHRASGSYRKADRYAQRIEQIRSIQEYLIEEARKTGIKIVNNVNIDQTVNAIVDNLIQNLDEGKRHE